MDQRDFASTSDAVALLCLLGDWSSEREWLCHRHRRPEEASLSFLTSCQESNLASYAKVCFRLLSFTIAMCKSGR